MDLIESYNEELRLVRKFWTGFWIVLLLIALIFLPWYGKEHWVYILTLIFIFSIGVQGQNLLIGYTGQISFGQAGFLALGAFTFGHLVRLGGACCNFSTLCRSCSRTFRPAGGFPLSSP